MNINDCKFAVALAALDHVVEHSIIGLGSGSTLEHFIRELGARCRNGFDIVGVPTSLQARLLAIECGVPLRDPMETPTIDLAVDGADEVDPAGNLIKGGGAAHTLEKIIAVRARRFLVIVDQSKLVRRLGARFAVPVDVLPPALPWVLDQLRRLGAVPTIRQGSGKIGPVISEVGNIVVDARFKSIPNPARLDRQLNDLPGVMGHGLFVHMAHQVLVARSTPTGPKIRTLTFKSGR